MIDYHVVETQTHLKVSKTEAKSVRSDVHGKRGPDGKARNSPRNGKESWADLQLELAEISLHSYVCSHSLEDIFLVYPSVYIICCMLQNTVCVSWSALFLFLFFFLTGHSESFRFFHKVKSQNLLSLNHVLVFYAVL